MISVCLATFKDYYSISNIANCICHRRKKISEKFYLFSLTKSLTCHVIYVVVFEKLRPKLGLMIVK